MAGEVRREQVKPSSENPMYRLLFLTHRGAIRKEKEMVKPREEQVGEVVLAGNGSGMRAAPSPTMVSEMAGDTPLLKHCTLDAASCNVMHLDEPPV